MRFDEEEKWLRDWKEGDQVIWYARWNDTNFGIYVAEAVNSKTKEDGTKESHIFLRIVKVICETDKTFKYKIGASTPGVWPSECYERLNDFHDQSKRNIICDYFRVQ